MEKQININDILEMSVIEIHEWYSKNFMKKVPDAESITLISEELGNLLSEYANYFVYFDYMHSILEAVVKEKKQSKDESAKNLMVKRDIIGHFADEMKFSYNALSRICTMKIESNKELNMLK